MILAGGRSTRFGADKAFALWNGKPFLQCVHEAIRGVCDREIVLVAPAQPLEKYARLAPGATVIPDRAPDQGPVEALRGARDFLRSPTLLVAPCDAPGLTWQLAKRLVIQSEETNKPVVVELPSGRVHTLFAAPRDVILARLEGAKRLEDLVDGGPSLATSIIGLNVNEAPKGGPRGSKKAQAA